MGAYLMGLLNAAQLTSVRRQAEASLDQTCVLRTFAADVEDAEGGTTPGAATVTNVACRKATPTGLEREIASRLGAEIDAVFTLPWETTVPVKAQIDDATGATFEVVNVNTGQSYQTAVRVSGKRLT